MSAVHEYILQPESFSLAPKCDKPTAKLGQVIDYIIKNRKAGMSIYESIENACITANYYATTWQTKIRTILEKGLSYYMAAKDYEDGVITLDDKQHDVVTACIKSIEANKEIMTKLHPKNEWGEDVDSYNEDAIFLNMVAEYNGKKIVLPLKMKADNWTIDPEAKKLTLNDVKTTGHYVQRFMRDDGSIMKYHYYRQLYMYGMMLQVLCRKDFEYDDDWSFDCNLLVVETVGDCKSKCCHINPTLLKKGKKEFNELIKRVACYRMFKDEEIKFI